MTLIAAGASVRYPGAASPALADVSLTLSPGEFIAVTGPNGSGKTTLLQALLGLARLEAGTVTLDGRGIAQWNRRALAATIGALPQREEPAFPLTVREAVLMGRWAKLGPIAPAGPADEAAIAEALARCDVAGFERRTLDTLSGGEWQRVRLARALVASPRFLLLDEPTAALDVGHEMELLELLRSLVAGGLGVLVITHQLDLAARYANRILLLDHGRTVADGPPAAVLTAEIVSRVFGWPVGVMQWTDGSPLIVPLRPGEVRPAGAASFPSSPQGSSS